MDSKYRDGNLERQITRVRVLKERSSRITCNTSFCNTRITSYSSRSYCSSLCTVRKMLLLVFQHQQLGSGPLSVRRRIDRIDEQLPKG